MTDAERWQAKRREDDRIAAYQASVASERAAREANAAHNAKAEEQRDGPR